MKEDYLKEKIKFNTEIIKLLVIVVLATGGGVVSLIISGTHNSARVFIIEFLGFVIIVIIYSVIYICL